ncbi:MAG: hypothetical protein MJ252_24140 [archaeon]|nr:hypothetical protein [archaeon]
MEELNEAELLRNLKAKDQELQTITRELETAKQTLASTEKQLKSEIERLTEQIKLKDKLIGDYSTQMDKAPPEITQEAFEEKKKEVEELTEKVASLENEKFLEKQEQTALERKVQSLTEENSQLKLEVNKLKEEKKNASNAALTADFNLEDLPKDLDEEVRKKFEGLLASKLEFEETSRQFGDLFEQTEKERQDLEDKLGLLEIEKNGEISKLKAEIQELKADIADGVKPLDLNGEPKKDKGGDDDSVNTEKFQTLQECYLDLENEYEAYKKNIDLELQNLNSRALTAEQRSQGFEEKLQEVLEEMGQKDNKIEELTQQIVDFQNNQENDKSQSFQLIESYMNEIKTLRDQRDEYEKNQRNKFNQMQIELSKQIEEEKREKEKAINDLEEYKRKNKNQDSEVKLKIKAINEANEKEIQERDIKINDLNRKMSEAQTKIRGLMENTKTLQLTKEKEIDNAKKAFQKKLDATVAEKETILENSKKMLQQIKELKETLEKKTEEYQGTLEVIEQKEAKEESAKVQELNDEITLLNHENDTLKDKNNELIKKNTLLENENTNLKATVAENEELKNNLKASKEMYEKQYNDLKNEMEQKLKELATSRRKNSTLRNSLSLAPNQTELMNKLNDQIKKLASEKEYFEKMHKTSEEQINKLKEVIEENKQHYEKQIEEIGKTAADSALMAATIAFDKDQQILTLKKMVKKLKAGKK